MCLSPTKNLWLLLREEHRSGLAGSWWPWSVWLNLESGEVRDIDRSLEQLFVRGWRLLEGSLEWEVM